MNIETLQFILQNIDSDVHQLAFLSGRYPLVDMSLAIRQINGMQKVKLKIPTFFANEAILYPAQLSLEQSSSESTATYKSTLCEGKILADLTGGFGVDCCFMSCRFEQVVYVERQEELCRLATHNFGVLHKNHIQVVNAQTEQYLQEMRTVDWIFIDPARRSSGGKKVVLLSDCEPDVSALSAVLLSKARQVMIKLSPMMDITAAVRELPNTFQVHIISVENECKEVLLLLDQSIPTNQLIKTINFGKNDHIQQFEFYADNEVNTHISYTSVLGKYLYEPNAAIMKSGAFKSISTHFGLQKLHRNTHLYTSDKLIVEFPGRVFEIKNCFGNSKKEIKNLLAETSHANISTRNYPLSVDELRRKLKIKDGGDVYLFACTLSNEDKVLITTAKAY